MQIAKIQMQMLGSIESQVAELRRLQSVLEATAKADMPVDQTDEHKSTNANVK
jgi:hypothetical protein